MKTVWVKSIPYKKEVVVAALEGGADAVMVAAGDEAKVKALGRIETVSAKGEESPRCRGTAKSLPFADASRAKGDIRPGRDYIEFTINDKNDEHSAAAALKSKKVKYVLIKTGNWRVIPLENLIAQAGGTKLLAEVKNAAEARTALMTLEKGVDGIALDSANPSEVRKVVNAAREISVKLNLCAARITKIKPLPMGDRVCVDTCTNMRKGQGMLVGSTAGGMFLVHSESVKTPYVAPRPFRVNAGAVHAYTLVPGEKTRYLQELSSGDEVLLVDYKGNTEAAIVGRSKIEKRPMLLVEARCPGGKISLILQNAETIRLTAPGGKPVSVAELKKNSTVLAYLEPEARHFGMKVKETITEK
jgi:3-dehydroquinate synthase II